MSTAVIYLFVIVLLRVFGQRSMAQLGPTDLVILMLLGSAVETSMVHGSTGLKAGLLSAVTLIALNRLLNFAMLKSKRFKHLVSGGPTILINQGKFIEEHLKRVGLTKADVLEALREKEFGDIAEIRMAILEPDGEVNVIPMGEAF